MELKDVTKLTLKRALITSAMVGTILNILTNSHYFPMFLDFSRFSWIGLGKILGTYTVPFVVGLYSQKFFIPSYMALLNIKNAFYLLDKNKRVIFVSRKLVEELNEVLQNEGEKKLTYQDIIGMKIEDLISKFGFHEPEREEILKRFKQFGELNSHNQVLGKMVNGRRYGKICSANPAISSDPDTPSQGMLIRKDDLNLKDRAVAMMLAKAAESKDGYTGKHILRMRKRSCAIGIKLGLSEEDLDILDLGSILHDVGKIGVEDKVLTKLGTLDSEEWKSMKTHPAKGGAILRIGKDPYFNKVALIPEQHHENFDGTGYPAGLQGDEINLLSRIVSVVDNFDALYSERPYKEPFLMEEVFKIMQKERGKKLDPKILDAFFEVLVEEKTKWSEFLLSKGIGAKNA
ncbi:MAG: HD-GYP domain-containing protein [Nitrospinales bacterium]